MTSGVTDGGITQQAYNSAGPARSITIPASGGNAPAVGDYMTLWVSCSAALTGGAPSGWTLVTSGQDAGATAFGYCYGRYCQSGDPGSTVTLPSATAVVRVQMYLKVKKGVAAASPVMASASLAEASADNTHDLPSLTLTAATRVDVFCTGKDAATASTGLTVPSGYTQQGPTMLSANSNQTFSALASSTADVSAGSLPSGTFTVAPSGATTIHAVTLAVAYTPVSTTTTGHVYTDVTLTGVSVVGGASGAAVLKDNDPSTYVNFPLSGVATVFRGNLRNDDGSPLSAPVTSISYRGLCPAGTTTMSSVLKLYVNGTLQQTYTADTTVSGTEGTFTHAILSADQTAQVGHLDTVDVLISITGS